MKKFIIAVVASLLIITLVFGLYLPNSVNSKKKDLTAYLSSQGYFDSEILNIHIENNVFYRISDYPRWWATVEFADEPGVEYQYYFSKDGKISQGTVTGGEAFYGILDKDALNEQLKHLE